MLRGNRVLGVAGLVAALAITFFLGMYVTELANPEHSERYQSYQSGQGDKTTPTTSVSDVTQPVMHYTPCEKPKSETQSDLCAQWRAAKAAEKSADWTAWGVIASIAGISLLLWQIILTREAVQDTGRATNAMTRANDLSARSYEEQTRPIITIENLICPSIIGDYCEIRPVWTNISQSPARVVSLKTIPAFRPCGEEINTEDFFLETNHNLPDYFSGAIIGSKRPVSNDGPVFIHKSRMVRHDMYIIVTIKYKRAIGDAEIEYSSAVIFSAQPLVDNSKAVEASNIIASCLEGCYPDLGYQKAAEIFERDHSKRAVFNNEIENESLVGLEFSIYNDGTRMT